MAAPESDGEVQLTKKEKRHKEYMEKLQKLEREFRDQRTKIYADNLQAFQQDVEEILNGTHPEFECELRSYEYDREQALQHAELYRTYRMECAKVLHQLEAADALKEFEKDKGMLRDKMLAAIEQKKRKLREDRETFDIIHALQESSNADDQRVLTTRKQTRSHAAKSDDTRKDKRRRNKELSNMILAADKPDADRDLDVIRRRGSDLLRTRASLPRK
ncbi:Sds3-like-domain-containing protein [Gaertneriomyces semiglobifer]|nr:Sds3-like-domain-containing protein [Gaertneriomyces semiglobifer]